MAIVIQWKQIKPGKMRGDRLRLALLSELNKVAREIRQDFEKTTKTWEHEPKFETAISLHTATGPEVLVGTDDEIYRYVNEGTRPHTIEAGIYTGRSKARALRFHSTFRAKTRPRYITSYRGYVGGKVLYRPRVRHPGTKARQFDKVLQKRWRPRFKRRMEQAMRAAARASGHGL